MHKLNIKEEESFCYFQYFSLEMIPLLSLDSGRPRAQGDPANHLYIMSDKYIPQWAMNHFKHPFSIMLLISRT